MRRRYADFLSDMLSRSEGGFAPTRNALIQFTFVLVLGFVIYEGAVTALAHCARITSPTISGSGRSVPGSTSISV